MFSEPITLVVENGQRLLHATGDSLAEKGIRVRILTEEKLQGLNDNDFHNYKKRLAWIVNAANQGRQMTDPETIRAYDYIRNTVEREMVRRRNEGD